MGTIHVVDSYALMAMEEQVPGSKLHRVLPDIANQIAAGWVSFPDAVPKECVAYPDEVGIATWIHAAAAGRPRSASPPFQYEQQVLHLCVELLDDDDSGLQPQIDVAAFALHLQGTCTDDEVLLVTGDVVPRADRASLNEAAPRLGLITRSVYDFLAAVSPNFP